jgi:hypothetical protein
MLALIIDQSWYATTELMINLFINDHHRLFYAGAMEGQMPEVLTMIQTEKNTPAPAVLFVVSL